MAENKKYVELMWHQKYDKIDLGEKLPIEKPNLPFQTMKIVNKPSIKGGNYCPAFSRKRMAKELFKGLEEHSYLGR